MKQSGRSTGQEYGHGVLKAMKQAVCEPGGGMGGMCALCGTNFVA